ncbi:MAG TPA: MaoC family dehydratase [Candidatus Binataceae bacterium]
MEPTSVFDPSEVYVGRDYGGAEYEITPSLIERYIAGTGDDNPWYRGPSPLGGPVAPALIVHSAVFHTHSWYLPNVYGNLHARQEFDFFAPVMVGERLHSRSVIAERYAKRDREYVVNETLIFDSAGRVITRGRTHQSFLMPERAEGSYAVDKSRERDATRTFKVGERGGEPIESPMIHVSEAMCMAFSGPAINYHTDREAARKLGFPEIVVQGMLSVCLAGAMMTRRFGVGFLCSGRFDLRLVNVLWANETTAARGRILERRPEGARTRAEVEVWCEKSDGTKTVVGSGSALEL